MSRSRPRRGGRGVAFLAALALFAAACGSDGESSDTTSATTGGAETTAGAATTASEETTTSASPDADLDLDATVRITTAAPGVSLDPHRERQSGDRDYTNLIYDRLTVINQDQSVAPMLAEEWEFSPDGSTLTLKLRTDATFQDGTPIDAAAVVANLQRGQTLEDSTVKSFLANITAIEATDASTVTLTIDGGGADLPAILATNVGMIVNPKAFTDGRDLILAPGDAGSGPFAVTEFVPNERAVYERVDGHWDPDAGKVARIEQGFIARGSSRVDGLRAGQLDLIQVTGADQAVGLPLIDSGEFGGFQITVLTGHQTMLNVAQGDLGNAELRKAMAQAVDKEAIADQLLEGNCNVTSYLLPPGHWAAPDDPEPFPYDVEAAKAALAQAGVSDPSLAISVAAGSSGEPVAQVVQSELQEIGVNATLNPLTQVEVDTGFRSGDLASYQGFIVGQSDPALLLNLFYFSESGYKLGGQEAVTKYQARATEANDPTLSQEERGELYKSLVKDIQDEAWSIPICHTKQLWMHTDKVGGISPDTPFIPVGLGDFRYVTVSK